jgi:hypothetical protein
MLVTGERVKEKKHPVSRVIKNFGSASDEETLNRLMQEAESYKNHLLAKAPKAKILKMISEADVKSCRSYNVGFSDIYGAYFHKLFGDLKTKQKNFLNQLHDLTVMRIASPASKRKTASISGEYGINLQVDSIYKLMDQISNTSIDQIKKTIYQHTVRLLSEKKEKIDIIIYDLTTIYFEPLLKMNYVTLVFLKMENINTYKSC